MVKISLVRLLFTVQRYTLRTYRLLFPNASLKYAPAKADTPATNPPSVAVSNTSNNQGMPFSEEVSTWPTRFANKFSLGRVCNKAMQAQRIKIALKLFPKDLLGLFPFHAARMKAMGAITHQGKKN